MLAVAPVGQKAKVPSIAGGTSTGGGPMHTNNFEIRSTNDDFAISNNGELEMFKRTNNDQRNGGSSQFGRNDPRNILGDVYVGRRTPERSPTSYQEVVQRLT